MLSHPAGCGREGLQSQHGDRITERPALSAQQMSSQGHIARPKPATNWELPCQRAVQLLTWQLDLQSGWRGNSLGSGFFAELGPCYWPRLARNLICRHSNCPVSGNLTRCWHYWCRPACPGLEIRLFFLPSLCPTSSFCFWDRVSRHSSDWPGICYERAGCVQPVLPLLEYRCAQPVLAL